MTFRFWEKIELSVLIGGLLIAGALWGFVELTEVARDPTPRTLDARILLAFREAGNTGNALGPEWLEGAVRDVTALGSGALLVLATAAALLYLLLIRRFREALIVLFAVGGGQVLASLLKLVIDRLLPYWESAIVPDLEAGKTVLVTAHGNSLRGLVKHLEGISDDDIAELNIPTGIPLVYELDENNVPTGPGRYLDPEAAAAGAAAVAAQGKK